VWHLDPFICYLFCVTFCSHLYGYLEIVWPRCYFARVRPRLFRCRINWPLDYRASKETNIWTFGLSHLRIWIIIYVMYFELENYGHCISCEFRVLLCKLIICIRINWDFIPLWSLIAICMIYCSNSEKPLCLSLWTKTVHVKYYFRDYIKP